ncbi:hypothetical protein SMC26_16555 [Actinomadura fulvescens]|uniref:Uncharacterized protein n=1 Tax=Actinomadura fulvescens TaxID=46160 RepID=A0ABN3PJ79_9ACTN
MRGVEYEKAKRVMQDHHEEIESRYHPVAGYGIGSVVAPEHLDEAHDEVFGIHVFLEDAGGLPTTPQSIEGVPLHFVVTGPFKPF